MPEQPLSRLSEEASWGQYSDGLKSWQSIPSFGLLVLCLKNGEHTRIEVFINLFPHRIRKWIEVFDYVVCFAFMALLAYHSIELLKINGAFRTAGANIPMYMVYSCIMVSGILMIPYFAVLIYQKIKEPEPPAITSGRKKVKKQNGEGERV